MPSAPSVIPRWEWRTFGERFVGIEARIGAAPHDLRHSAETYILSRRSDASVKIRHGVLEVKLLVRVDDSLELWDPALELPFPVGPDGVRSVCAHWAVSPPLLTRAAYGPRQFIHELVRPNPDLTAIDVGKERRSAVIENCTVELASLMVGGRNVCTVAVESVDPERVRHAVRALGLSLAENVNYVIALKQMLGILPTANSRCTREGTLPHPTAP